ncbi:uncharacterized protein [Coffea arabica]|uniref:Myb/SANT-like domain-containing protein n=1 Tax=Coffea arabica TaxID=13443 RepID=A0ABM4VGA3_COFAR
MAERWKVTLANHTAMAAYLTQELGVICTGTQSQSKFYRVVDKWRLFTHLRGDSAKAETGIGWDEEHRCFVAGKEQWGYLYKLDKSYVEFQHPNSADLMILWDEVMDGKHATGTRAQFLAQFVPPQFVPPRIRRRRGDSTLKGKGVASSSVINPADSKGTSDDTDSPIMSNPGKRPLGSASQSSENEDSRGTKSRRSGSENYQEALSNFNRFSSIACSERESKEKYSIEVAKKAVEDLKLDDTVHMYVLKELLDGEFRALFISFSESEQITWINLFIVPKIVGK